MSFPTAHRQPASDTASIQSRSNSRRMASHSRTNLAGALPRGRYGRADGRRDAPAAILLHVLTAIAREWRVLPNPRGLGGTATPARRVVLRLRLYGARRVRCACFSPVAGGLFSQCALVDGRA